jgi:class 3 adenylate cyclase/tetratricopeptide (TPR) repeat protein
VAGAAADGPVPVLAPVASRRVTSILFGDLVGFTSLSEARDQEDVRELLSRYFDESRAMISRYGGSVEKFIGDAVMAVWGAATIHEDDAERAVRAGLELVTTVAHLGEDLAVPGLAMRVGIVTGEVAVTVGATQQGMVAGDPVNTAARVQAAAGPGQVWVDETTRVRSAAAISYVDVGSHRLKGKSEPMPLWWARAVVAGVGGAQRADGLEAPLVGRDRDLRLVKEMFHHCEESGRPTLLVVDGDPGVGKSRLAWELEKYADGLTSQVRWHSGRCVAYGEGVAYYALAEAVRGRLQSLSDPDADDEPVSVLLDRALDRYVPDREEREWMRDRIAALLGIGSVVTIAREDLFSAWLGFLERVGEGHLVTLIVDDAQYADEGLLGFVEHVLTSAGFSCFVVLLTRPGLLESHPVLATHRNSSVIHLLPLADRDVTRLLDELVAGLPEPVRDQLVERSEGVPLFAVETIRSLIDRDLVVPRGGRYVLADGGLDLDRLAVPDSLQALIAARLDTLTPEQRTVIDRASVLGLSFSPAVISAVCDDVPDIDRVLQALVRLQLLSRETRRMSAEYDDFRFVQSAVRLVAYATLSRRDRKAIHLAVIAQFDRFGERGDDVAAIRAQHYVEAAEAVPSDPDVAQLRAAALGDLRRAADRARSLGSPAEAVRHLASAMTLVEEPALRARVGCERAQAQFDAGDYQAAIAQAREAREALETAGDRLGAGLAVAIEGLTLVRGLFRNEQGLALVQPWWEEFRAAADTEQAAETLMVLSQVISEAQIRLGVDVRDVVEFRMRLVERSGATQELANCYNTLAVYYFYLGVPSLGEVLLEAAAGIARDNHDLDTLSRTCIILAAQSLPQDAVRAVEYATEGLTIASKTGIPGRTIHARALYALAVWTTGAWDAIDAPLPGQLADRPALVDEVVESAVFALRALARGRTTQSVTPLDHVEIDAPVLQGWHEILRSTLAQQTGDLPTALVHGMAAVELIHGNTGVWDDLTHVWWLVAALAIASADENALQRLLSIVDESRSAIPRGLRAHRAHVRALLAIRDGHDDDVEPALTDALEGYAAWGAVPFEAKAKGVLGRWLKQQGRDEEAARWLGEARKTLTELRAEGWLAELDEPWLGMAGELSS